MQGGSAAWLRIRATSRWIPATRHPRILPPSRPLPWLLPTQDNDILDRAIVEAQRLVVNLLRVKEAIGTIGARYFSSTRRTSRRQVAPASSDDGGEVHDLVQTNWEITRQQNGSLDSVVRRYEAQGKLLPCRDPYRAARAADRGAAWRGRLGSRLESRQGVLNVPSQDPGQNLSEDPRVGLPLPDDLPEILPEDFDFSNYPGKPVEAPSPPAAAPQKRPGRESEDDGTASADIPADRTLGLAAPPPAQPEPEAAPLKLEAPVPQADESLSLQPAIKHEFDGKLLVLYPNMEQWLDFTALLRFARERGANRVGAFKVRLSEEVLHHLGPCREEEPVPRPKKACNGFRSRRLPNMTFSVTTTNDSRVFRQSDPSSLSLSDAVRHHEHLHRKKQGFRGVFYRTDIPVQTPDERYLAGLHTSKRHLASGRRPAPLHQAGDPPAFIGRTATNPQPNSVPCLPSTTRISTCTR